jgi:elongation factor Ts
MAGITAAAVKSLRDKTQLPLMECKGALVETGGDEQAAIDLLRKQGHTKMMGRADRSTEEGRIGSYVSIADGVGALVEVQCESAPVAGHEDFVQLVNELATQLAKGPGASSAEELLSQDSSSGGKLQQQWDDLTNKMREVFRLTRVERIDGPCGGYVHHDGKSAVMVHVEGGDQNLAKQISMHIVAMKPQVLNVEDLDPAVVEKERTFLLDQARKEGKPENILEKMVEGRMRNFYAGLVLSEQAYVHDDKQTVGKVAEAAGVKINRFVSWRLGKE